MCSLKLSKNIIPFAITFSVGILLAGLFSGMFSCFSSSSNVETQQVNEVKVYSSKHKEKSMCNMKGNDLEIIDATEESEIYIDSSDIKKELRIEEPTFEQTIIINEEVKQTRK